MRVLGFLVRPSILVFSGCVLGLTGCASVYTLSPAVKESARRYSEVMDDFADQALLANVLRARDQAPMNFNDLSSITGALSLSATSAATVPFGPYIGNRYVGTALGAPRDTGMPSISGSTSPVIKHRDPKYARFHDDDDPTYFDDLCAEQVGQLSA
jgi:hypothetical protein